MVVVGRSPRDHTHPPRRAVQGRDRRRNRWGSAVNACEKSLPGGLLLTVHRPRTDVVVVSIAGEVDLSNCPELDRVVMRVPADPGIERVVVDLTGVGFLAACGVRCLARLQMRLAAD